MTTSSTHRRIKDTQPEVVRSYNNPMMADQWIKEGGSETNLLDVPQRRARGVLNEDCGPLRVFVIQLLNALKCNNAGTKTAP